MKRKVMSLLLAGTKVATMFAGCGDKKEEAPATDNNNETE